MSTDPAVTAAAEALHATNDIEQDDYGRAWFADPEATAARLVAAARPIIEAEVRERIAADLLRDCRAERHSLSGNRTCRYCERAARIARGRS